MRKTCETNLEDCPSEEGRLERGGDASSLDMVGIGGERGLGGDLLVRRSRRGLLGWRHGEARGWAEVKGR